MQIGPYRIKPRVVLAPMAGVTDKPFRMLCKRLGAGLCVSEMTIADPRFWSTRKSFTRMDHADEPAPVSVQIAGTEPGQLANAARYNVEHGAQIIDINMGCPAKKVCNAWAGSALMRDPMRVARILDAVVAAVDVPVTLKIRTGWDRAHRNALEIARIAQDCGIAALSVHGRTRDQLYNGQAEYDTIAAVKAAVTIPVLANGDIDSPQRARFVLDHTGADAVMIGRAAIANPWIFGDAKRFMAEGLLPGERTIDERLNVALDHLRMSIDYKGDRYGIMEFRKYWGGYLHSLPLASTVRRELVVMNDLDEIERRVLRFREEVDEFNRQREDRQNEGAALSVA